MRSRYDDYENLDEYEEDGEDQEVEDVGEGEYEEHEEEAPKPEVLDYLELRQRLKEEKRKELKKECGTLNGSMREQRNTKDGYGSFFGPSQPVIASRVIQESKSLIERASTSGKVNKSNQSGNRNFGSTKSANKSQASGQKPIVANGLQTKVELLKNTRDYSFLFSDDAGVPVPKKEPSRKFSAHKPEVRPALPDRNKGSFSNGGQKAFGAHENKKASAPVNRMQPKVGAERVSSGVNQVQASIDSKKHLGTPNGTLVDPRKPVSSSNGSGPGRPVVTKTVPSKVHVGASEKKVNGPVSRASEKKVSRPVSRTPAPILQRPAPSKSNPPVSRQSFPRKEEYRASEKPRLMQNPTIRAPKLKQQTRPPPNTLARDISRDGPRKKPVRHGGGDDDTQEAFSMLRSMMRYDPRKYQDEDYESDGSMEVGFNAIMREEKRSEKIGRREDEEELLKIEEEERRERMRRETKKRKLSNR